jgi:inosine-uridine nucleoside N-ribohydrolase
MKVIIDCDPGVDDAFALMLASQHAEILAVTIVAGNASVEQCAANAQLILPHVPIFLGRSRKVTADGFFQTDALMNTNAPPFIQYNKLNASEEITRLVNKYPGEITIIALGPLTNLYDAYKQGIDTTKIKQIHIMGGNFPHCIVQEAEYNFKLDPIAAKTVIEQFKCPIRIYTLELTYKCQPWFQTIQLRECSFVKELHYKSRHLELTPSVISQIKQMNRWVAYNELHAHQYQMYDFTYSPCDFIVTLIVLFNQKSTHISVPCAVDATGKMFISFDKEKCIEIVCDYDHSLNAQIFASLEA